MIKIVKETKIFINNQKGLTLVELMVVVAIIAILAIVTLRGFATWSTATKIESDVDALFTFLQDARLMAFSEKRALNVSLSSDGRQVTLTDANTNQQISTLTLQSPFVANISNIKITNRGIFNNCHIRYNGNFNVASYDCINTHVNRLRRGKINVSPDGSISCASK